MGDRQIEVRCQKLPYTNIQNKLIWDERLRPQTKWVLIAMLSLPEDWDYSIRGLAKKTGLAKETISEMTADLPVPSTYSRTFPACSMAKRTHRVLVYRVR